MNIKLLRKIQRALAREPRRLDMDSGIKIKDRIAPCGTTACIAGHAVIYSNPKYCKVGFKTVGETLVKENPELGRQNRVVWRSIKNEASEILGLDEDQAERLFHRWYWPETFSRPYLNATTRRAKSKVAIARIEHFIKTKGKE